MKKTSDPQRMSRLELFEFLESAKTGRLPVLSLWAVDVDGTITRQRAGQTATVTAETLIRQFNRDSDHLLCIEDAVNKYISEPGPVLQCDSATAKEIARLFADEAKTIKFYE